MTTQQPELAARLVLDMVAAADAGDDEPLERFLLAIAKDARTVDEEQAGPVLAAVAGVLVPALPHLLRTP